MLTSHEDNTRKALLSGLEQSLSAVHLFVVVFFLGEGISIEGKSCQSLGDFDPLYLETSHRSLHEHFIEEPLKVNQIVGK